MRLRVVALMLIGMPAVVVAQTRMPRLRVPIIQRRTPPVEKPPQAPGIPDARLYSQKYLLRMSMESYPMVSLVSASGFVSPGIPSNFTAFGMGTRIDYRITPKVSTTLDFTSSNTGGPFSIMGLEAGTRLHPWTIGRVRGFVDTRATWNYTAPALPFDAAGGGFFAPIGLGFRSLWQRTEGWGGLAGTGVEIPLAYQWSLSTGINATYNRMRAYPSQFAANTAPSSPWNYSIQSARLTVGLRYNPMRWVP